MEFNTDLDRRFGRVSFADISNYSFEENYIIDKLIPVNELAVIAGPSTAGKSFAAIDMGMCIALGKDFHGFKTRQQGLVIYQAGEGRNGIRRRVQAFRDYHKIPKEKRVPFELLTQPVDLFTDADFESFCCELQNIVADHDEPFRCLFIDTLAVASLGFGADENSGRDMGLVLGRVRKISLTLGCSVVLVHHLNAAGTRLRGHSSIFNNLEAVIQVSIDPATEIRTLFVTKQKDDKASSMIQFKLRDVMVGKRPDGDPIYSAVMNVILDGKTASETPKQGLTADGRVILSDKLWSIFKALDDTIKRDPRDPPDHIVYDRDTAATTLTDWREQIQKVIAKEAGDETADALTQRAKSDRDDAVVKLLKLSIIGKQGDWVWRTGRRVANIDPEIRVTRGFEEEQHDDPIF